MIKTYELYNLIARTYNAKPKNIVRYVSVSHDVFDYPAGQTNLYYEPDKPTLIGNTNERGVDLPFWFGNISFRAIFNSVNQQTGSLAITLNGLIVKGIDIPSDTINFSQWIELAYDTSGAVGIPFPSLNNRSFITTDRTVSGWKNTLTQKPSLAVIRTGANVRILLNFTFDGFMVNFK